MLTQEDIEGGTGFMKYYKEGARPTLKEILHLMISASDNVATNLLGQWIGSKARGRQPRIPQLGEDALW